MTHQSYHLVILTGAGVSADSGVATFRGGAGDGLWHRYDWQALATPEAFAERPAEVHAFYNARRAQLETVAPNPAHLAIADLEARLTEAGHRLTLITQNVDNLHERAGSSAPLHMHGELTRIRCTHCGDKRAWEGDLDESIACIRCGNRGGLRPDIVWFGEVPMGLEAIDEALDTATLFAAIGTSGNVYPAAGLVSVAKERGARTVLLNLDAADNSAHFDEEIPGYAAQTVPAWAAGVIAHVAAGVAKN